MNRNFVEILSELSAAGAEFLLVGGWAVAAHGFPRYTGDFDIWVRAEPRNAHRVYAALAAFGAPLEALEPNELAAPGLVFQMGLPPQRIDILTQISGVAFEDAWAKRVTLTLDGVEVPIIGLDDLITNKRTSARPKDLLDAEQLEAIRERSS